MKTNEEADSKSLPKIEGTITMQGGSLYAKVSRMRIAILDTTAIGKGLYLNRINIPHDHQGRGLGSQMLSTLKVKARKAGHHQVIVEPGGYDPKRRGDQLRFYTRNGFVLHKDGYYVLDLTKDA